MTVTFIRFINEVTDDSANNQLAGCKTQKHFLDELLLYEAPTCDAVLTEWTWMVYPCSRSLAVYRVKVLYEYGT